MARKPASLVSIILTVRGEDRFLRDAFRTICEQEYRPLEVVLIDDGILWQHTSLSKLEEICRRASVDLTSAESRIPGRAMALNCGLRESRGALIAILDVDDCWHPKKLRLQVEVLDEAADAIIGTDTVSIYGDHDVSDEDLRRNMATAPATEDITPEVLLHCPLTHSSVLMPRHLLEKLGGYDESRPSQLDWDIFARAVQNGSRLYKLRAPLTFKRLHSGQSFEAKNKVRYLFNSIVLQLKIQRSLQAPLRYRLSILRRAIIWLLPRKVKHYLIRRFRGT